VSVLSPTPHTVWSWDLSSLNGSGKNLTENNQSWDLLCVKDLHSGFHTHKKRCKGERHILEKRCKGKRHILKKRCKGERHILTQRKDVKGKDTFSLPEWWRCNSGSLPHFSFVLRALLTNAPNSCPQERLFSMFNATFGEDQRSAFGDYLELAMQSQYNKRYLWATFVLCVSVCDEIYIYICPLLSRGARGVCTMWIWG